MSTRSLWVLKKYGFLLAAVLWMLSLSVASLISASYLPEVEEGIPHLDIIAHATFYMVAALLLYLHFRNMSVKGLLVKIAVFCFTYGMVIEALQYSMPYDRAFEWQDILANGTGILLAIILIKFILQPGVGLKGKF